MSYNEFRVGDVVEYRASWLPNKHIIGIVVEIAPGPYDAPHVYLNWISAPPGGHLHWAHKEGDFLADTKLCTKIASAEDIHGDDK